MVIRNRALSIVAVIGCLAFNGPSSASAQDCSSNTAKSKDSITRLTTGSVDDLKRVARVFIYTGYNEALYSAVTEKLSLRHLEFVNDIEQADVVVLVVNDAEPTPPGLRLPSEYGEPPSTSADANWTGTVLRRHGRNSSRIVMQVADSTGESTAERLSSEFLRAYDAANN